MLVKLASDEEHNGGCKMKYDQEQMQPIVKPIKNGWAAYGDGWAVHASTFEGAVQRFREAVCRHQEIDKLPFWYERFRTEQADRERYD